MQKYKKIDQYQLMQIIGKGANGFVYKGLNTQNGSLVAVKELFIGKSEVKAIKTELDLLKELDHPNIVKFIDAIQKENRIYLILQFMEGGSLAVLVRKSPLHEDVAKIYIKQVLNGLIFLHKKDVIHRDIKGANILLTKNGLVKLADFGVAVKLQQNQKTISAAGSPYWMAPQNISSSGEQPTAKCDIWSLGCTLIQLLSGNPPYYDLMQFPAMFRIVEDEHPPLPECSALCREFLLACFVKEPGKRPSGEELLGYGWLKDANQLKLANSLKQQAIIKQIEQALRPPINYAQLTKLAHPKTSLLMCKNPYFQSLSQDQSPKTGNPVRLKLLLQLIQSDQQTIPILYKTNLIQQQFDKFHNKFELSEEYFGVFWKFVVSFMRIYWRNWRDGDGYRGGNGVGGNNGGNGGSCWGGIDVMEVVILRVCLPSFWKLLHGFGKDGRNWKQAKNQLLVELLNFLCTLQNKPKQQQTSTILQIIQQLQQTNFLKYLLSLSLPQDSPQSPNLTPTIPHLKLQILSKLIPSFPLLLQLRPTFRKYISFTISQLLRDGFMGEEGDGDGRNGEKEEVLLVRLMCVRDVVGLEFCKAELQRNGFVGYLAVFFGGIVRGLGEGMGLGLFFQGVALLEVFLSNSRNGIDRNRVLQFRRHKGTRHVRQIYDFITSKQKTNKKPTDPSPIQKLTNLLQILQS